ncbi:hypothetical protein Tco_0490361 [Tanacetum coccineum]
MVIIHHLSQNTTQLKRRGFSQLKVNLDYSSEEQQDGKDKLVKSSTLIGSLMPRGLKEAQEMMIFTLDILTQVTQAVTSKDCQLGNLFQFYLLVLMDMGGFKLLKGARDHGEWGWGWQGLPLTRLSMSIDRAKLELVAA